MNTNQQPKTIQVSVQPLDSVRLAYLAHALQFADDGEFEVAYEYLQLHEEVSPEDYRVLTKLLQARQVREDQQVDPNI